ncbi:MAG: sulfurtransferase [Acidimicrobiia bacterium]|nr:sulfurtransferase [Acidimicrobiia bacterium]
MSNTEPTRDVPEGCRTTLGLYVTPNEAHEMLASGGNGVKILDVRTPEEYAFVGHPEMAMNIPFVMHTYRWEPELGRVAIEMNARFMPEIAKWADPADTILVMCRSGGRAAMAVNALADAGYTNVYNILEGMEGERVNDPRSVFHRKRMVNGWKNAGLPWTYDLNPAQMRLPTNPPGGA